MVTLPSILSDDKPSSTRPFVVIFCCDPYKICHPFIWNFESNSHCLAATENY